jgi:hypothetical protein
VSGQSGAVDIQRVGERVTQRSSVVEQRIGKAAQELANKPDLRGFLETFYDSLKKGRRHKRSIRFA